MAKSDKKITKEKERKQENQKSEIIYSLYDRTNNSFSKMASVIPAIFIVGNYFTAVSKKDMKSKGSIALLLVSIIYIALYLWLVISRIKKSN